MKAKKRTGNARLMEMEGRWAKAACTCGRTFPILIGYSIQCECGRAYMFDPSSAMIEYVEDAEDVDGKV